MPSHSYQLQLSWAFHRQVRRFQGEMQRQKVSEFHSVSYVQRDEQIALVDFLVRVYGTVLYAHRTFANSPTTRGFIAQI